MNNIERVIDSYANIFPIKIHLSLSLLSLISFICIIVFGFAPVTNELEQASGYTTMDLQNAKNRAEVRIILEQFEPVMDLVRLITLLDYLFIISGLLLFVSIHSINLRLTSSFRFRMISIIGILVTILSRSLDAIEDLFVILIYSNPDGYKSYFITAIHIVETSKWIAVGVEYILFLSALISIIYQLAGKNR